MLAALFDLGFRPLLAADKPLVEKQSGMFGELLLLGSEALVTSRNVEAAGDERQVPKRVQHCLARDGLGQVAIWCCVFAIQKGPFLKHQTFFGNEIVANTRRMCLMNMFLHNIGEMDGESPISPNDALVTESGVTFDYVLANPPFGKKSSMTFTNDEGEQETDELTYNRQDFWASTSNKQLNFVQHIRSMLKTTGRAAVVLPDNVLFEGGAGEIVRKKLLQTTELHTILRLPTGIFYAQGVKANVLFFDNRVASNTPQTESVWYFDYRTNIHHTLKKKPMRYDDLGEFLDCYQPGQRHKRSETWDAEANPEGRWRKYGRDELLARDKTSLDVFWLKDKSLTDLDNLPEPDVLAEEIIENLEAGLNSFREVLAELK